MPKFTARIRFYHEGKSNPEDLRDDMQRVWKYKCSGIVVREVHEVMLGSTTSIAVVSFDNFDEGVAWLAGYMGDMLADGYDVNCQLT
jgi:hypothetical protein